jgi:hypothetical protein
VICLIGLELLLLRPAILHAISAFKLKLCMILGLLIRKFTSNLALLFVKFSMLLAIEPILKNTPDALQDLFKRRSMYLLHRYAFPKRIDVLLRLKFLQYSGSTLAIIISKRPSEAQALRAALLVVSLLYPYEINKPVHNGLLSILDRLLKNRRRYYGVTKHRSMEIAIQRPTSLVELTKNGILLVLLNAFNDIKGWMLGRFLW